MTESMQASSPQKTQEPGFVKAIGLFDGTMIVVGSMIGSGIFIVAADITRQTGSAGGLLLTWILTGLLTVSAALSYGELAAMFPRAGGQYIYLREAYSPLWGFLYGWTLFLVIQTGTIAAVAVGFARYLGVLFPAISGGTYLIHPINLSSKYAMSLSVQQFVAVLMIIVLTFLNTLGVRLGKWIQNIFTSAKALSLLGLIFLCLFVARNHAAIVDNFSNLWIVRGAQPIEPGANFLRGFVPTVTAASGAFGLFVALGVAQVGSLFSADAWNNIGFTAADVKNPKRDVALSMAFGTVIVITLYCLANLAYLFALPLAQIQNAPDDRVASAALAAVFGPAGAGIMAIVGETTATHVPFAEGVALTVSDPPAGPRVVADTLGDPTVAASALEVNTSSEVDNITVRDVTTLMSDLETFSDARSLHDDCMSSSLPRAQLRAND